MNLTRQQVEAMRERNGPGVDQNARALAAALIEAMGLLKRHVSDFDDSLTLEQETDAALRAWEGKAHGE
jgi:hypothetical protein